MLDAIVVVRRAVSCLSRSLVEAIKLAILAAARYIERHGWRGSLLDLEEGSTLEGIPRATVLLSTRKMPLHFASTLVLVLEKKSVGIVLQFWVIWWS